MPTSFGANASLHLLLPTPNALFSHLQPTSAIGAH
jgi:hypothetical protein